jgi:glycosyltransferase involved in cell wall biosynthesis
MDHKIAVAVPCYNEEQTIAKVIRDLRACLPEAELFVFNNNSTDRTAETALQEGATVLKEKRQGKGYVVQSIFSKIDADVLIMVDGDDTYDLSQLRKMVAMVRHDEADMVVGNRLENYTDKSFRPLHTFGNRLVSLLINRLFKADLKDIMSGFRVMNRSFVKNINVTASGFEVETEMSIKALKYGYVISEVDIHYRERPPGSFSKLSTFRDGALVLKTIFIIFKDYKPLFFFSAVAGIMLFISVLSGSVVITEFLETRYITHVPLAIFAAGSMILALILFVTGVILDSANRRFDELYNFIKNKS